MAKVAIVSPERVAESRCPALHAEHVSTDTYFEGERQPLHLHRHELAPDARLRFDAMPVDRINYVWTGTIVAGGHRLGAGSSFIVERNAALGIIAVDGPAVLLTFAATDPAAGKGGHVHLLPTERVPRSADLGGSSGTGGGMHADAACPTSTLWLHENHMPGRADGTRRDSEAGIHSHTEDEIIFVTGGQIRLGARLYGPGTAMMIAADTLYSFTPGPEGVSFINFRAGMPGDIRFANGTSMSETGYWRERLPRPVYIEL